MRALLSSFAAAAFLAGAGSAVAQEADRYRLERTESGFVRMDMQSGAMSFCEEKAGQLACRPATDAEAASATDDTSEVAALERKVEALERRIAALEGKPPAAELPSEEEFEKTMTLMERFLRRFWGVAKDLERESETGAQPAPDRT